ncbi:protein translocase subunit yidC [Roseovarius halotolerans]|uniref:Membrane protein insertase YidC n=1 Tax=Roseovarius halotolerans TaxID=505353 RepID=A0A1X6ZWF5_9RHOB|nr:membrane protein insertase YidC [Roseovarius halotolerans]RKT32111.1 protein translocase subunit yidC [Roseovarius halotolerans]SLN63817.1 Membrane protein insertase YidC [Roseovarius halotolerans]
MNDQNKNLILATALSFIVILVWFLLFPPPEPAPQDNLTAPETVQGDATLPDTASAPATAAAPPTATGEAPAASTAAADSEPSDAPRVPISTPSLKGSISLEGGRIDELALRNYRETLEPDADIVTLLSPVGSSQPYYALFGWAPGQGLTPETVPGANTLWEVQSGDELTPDSPLTLVWDNGEGLVFRREISVDEKFMFTVTQSVENTGNAESTLAPYGILARHGKPVDLKNFFILHEGGISMVDGELSEIDYDDFEPATNHQPVAVAETGWTGFTDHYWMTTLVPGEGDAQFTTFEDTRRNIYQTTAKQSTKTLAPGTSITVSTRLFAGAKEWDTIRDYQNEQGIDRFLDSIDWGWFFFLTKPIFAVLHWLNATFASLGLTGSMGWAIIALTLLIKAILMPLAYKSYVSMAKMKELQPQMEKIKESAGDDRQRLQKEMMELYKKEKVNPASGCLPILLQIPIFFSLYKVIFVTLELRHAPWIGWIRDLSAPDPSSLYNLWGILPWGTPEPGSVLALIFIGILPLLLGISMWLQQKLNPAPTDPTQQMIFAWMPWVFMFMLGSFASGLVIYWIANNTITFTQQYLIMRSQGYKPDVLGNILSSLKRKPRPDQK